MISLKSLLLSILENEETPADKEREKNRKKWKQNTDRWDAWKKDPANAGKVAARKKEKEQRKKWWGK